MDITDSVRRCPYCGELALESQIESPVDYCHHDIVQRRYWFTPGAIECRPDLTVCPLCGNDPAKCPKLFATPQG